MLNSITQILEQNYMGESEWFSQFFVQEGDKKILKEEDLNEKLFQDLSTVADLFCRSVLIGEYVKDVKSFQKTIKEIKKITSDLYEATLFEENSALSTGSMNFLKIIEESCNTYQEFQKHIEIHTNNSGIEIVFITPKERDQDFINSYNYFSVDLLNNFNNFYLLLSLNQLDHFFDESINYFKSLIQLENRFNSIKSTLPYIGAINEKISFLKYKWKIRQITTLKTLKLRSVQRSYIAGAEVFSINESPQFQSSNHKLSSWKEHLDNHYEYTEHSDYYSRNFKIIVDTPKPNFFQYHFLIKYFKDIDPSFLNLKELIENIELRKEEFAHNDSKDLFYKNYNYSLNNAFSFLVDENNVSEEEINSLKAKIDSLQTRTGNDNFFVDYKFLKYTINKLKNLVKNREPLEINNTVIIEKIEKIRSLIISCENKIEWSVNHHNLLYQLPYDESLVEYFENEHKTTVYYASSFLLPLSVEQSHQEFQNLKLDFQNNHNNHYFLTSLNKEFQVIRELQDKAKTNDKKSIETLSIFTAVISFIVGTVSGFSFITSFVQALIFMLIFSVSLVTFVLLIFTSTKGIERIKNNWKSISIFYGSFLLLLVLLFLYKNLYDDRTELEKLRIKKEISNKKYIDSLNNLQSKEIASLKQQSVNQKMKIDTLDKKLKMSNFKVENLQIINKNIKTTPQK